jgi:hypothetical protein
LLSGGFGHPAAFGLAGQRPSIMHTRTAAYGILNYCGFDEGLLSGYLILAGIALIVLGVNFRHSLSEFLVRLFFKKSKRK